MPCKITYKTYLIKSLIMKIPPLKPVSKFDTQKKQNHFEKFPPDYGNLS